MQQASGTEWEPIFAIARIECYAKDPHRHAKSIYSPEF